MTQDKAHPTPPAVPSEREWELIDPAGLVVARETSCIRAWARIDGYKPTVEGLLGYEERGWRVRATPASLAAPVASNTTAEPAPIQPAGVEVERDVKRAREILARLCDRGLVSMSIPVRDDDEDMVLSRIINLAASQGDRGKT